MAYTDQQVLQWFLDNPNASDAQIAQTAAAAGVSADQISRVTGVPAAKVTSRSNPNISFTPNADSEGTQYSSGNYTINGTPVNAIYGTVAGTGGDDPNAGARSGVSGFSGGIQNIGGKDYTAQYDASGRLLGYLPYAGESTFSSLVKPLLPVILSAVAPGVNSLLGGATGLTGAQLAAATGATLGGGTAALTGQDVLKGAVTGGLTGYAGSSLFGNGSTDLGMNSKLTPAALEAGLGTEGYGFSSSAAQSGLFNPATVGSGAYTQTSYPYDMADFLSADALQLQGQVGNNIPAIEQNLVASGVDPLVAADIANQVTLNPNISQYDLTDYINKTFGGDIYDVNAAAQSPSVSDTTYSNEGNNYPTTTSTQGAGGSPVNATAAAAGLTASQIANLIKAGAGLLGASALANNMSNTGVGALPTQGVPTGNQDYYNAIQQYYNAYMPSQPRDVAAPLQNWYSKKYGA